MPIIEVNSTRVKPANVKPAMSTPLQVAVAVISDKQGRILLSKRSASAHQGGLWEFPGGKVDAGEDVYAALTRELKEELNIIPQQARPLIKIHHDYLDQSVLLDVWRVTDFAGRASGQEGQPLEWVRLDQLSEFDFPAANHAIVKAAQLPCVYLITKSIISDVPGYFEKLALLLRAGIKLVQFRIKESESSDFRRLASETLRYCRSHGAKLMVNADPNVAEELGADGVHLSSDRLMALRDRPLGLHKWVAASCHNAQELTHAANLGVDFAVLSPVLATKSHPGADTLGWETFSDLVESAPMPVYALGGMNPQQMQNAYKHGAQGAAVLSALWDKTGNQQDNEGDGVNDLMRAVKEYIP